MLQENENFGIESAGWEGGRLLPGTGNDKVLYYVNDHLGSVRAVKDGAGTIRQRYDYYPYGSVSRSWSSATTDTPDKRYRFSGKEIAGAVSNATSTGADKYLDFGARLYNPRTAIWLSQDPMAEDYYRMTPYLYCAGNPVNVVDPEGKDWFQNTMTGELYYNKDYKPTDVGMGYMSDNPSYWIYLAPNDSFCVSDLFLTGYYSTTNTNGGFVFNANDAKKAMGAVGYSCRPFVETVQVSQQTEFFSEGQDEVSITRTIENIHKTERWIYAPSNYYQTYTKGRKENFTRKYSSAFPTRITTEEWTEKRVYSYKPKSSKDKTIRPPLKEIIFIIIKSIAQSL